MANYNFGDIPETPKYNFGDIPETPKYNFGDIPKAKASLGGIANQFGIGLANEALLGVPLYALEKTQGEDARKALESNVPVERIARGAGTTVGMVVGLPKLAFTGGVKAAQAVGRAVVGAEKASKINRFVKAAAKAGAGVGAYELTHAPEENFKEKLITVPTAAIFGAGVGVLGEAVTPPIVRFLTKKGLIKGDFIGGTRELDTLNTILRPAPIEESAKLKVTNFGNIAETQLIDRYAPLRHIQESAQKFAEKPLEFSQKPYEAARLYSGVGGKIANRFEKLASIIEPYKRFIKPIEQIFTAERLLERAGRGFKNPRGVTAEQAQKMLGDIEAAVGPERYKELAATTTAIRREFTDGLMKELVEAGVMDAGSYARVVSKNQFYAPFEVIEYVNKSVDHLPTGKGAFRVFDPGFLKKIEGTEKDINSPLSALMRYTINTVELAEKNKVVQKFVNLRNTSKEFEEIIQPLADGKVVPDGFGKINVFYDGVKKSYAVPKEIEETLKGLNAESVDIITKFASASSRALRAGATQLNLSFVVPNIIRDLQTATLVSKVGFSATDWVRGAASALKKDAMYKSFLESGGSFGSFSTTLRRTLPENINELVPSMASKIGVYTNPIKWLNKVAEISEQSTRLGVFSRGLRSGLTGEEAAFNARNSTVDFAKMGTKMKIANMWVPFLNARTQGTLNMFKASGSHPKRFALTASAVVGAPATLTFLWNTTQYPDVWDSINRREKENYFLLITGRQKDSNGVWSNVHKIPKGDAGRILGNPLESFYEFLRGNDPDYARLALKILDDISPVGFGDSTVSAILPPAVKAGVETVTNKNLFTGLDIVPRKLQGASPTEQYTEKTAPMAVQIGKLTGISPMKVENTVGTLFGGLGRQVLDPLNAKESFARRFSGARGTAEQDLQFEILEDVVRDSSDQKAMEMRFINQALKDYKSVTPLPPMQREFIRSRFANNPKALNKFVEALAAEASGQQPIDRALKTSSVDDRIKFIQQYVQTIETDEEKILFIQDMFKKDVLTEQGLKNYFKDKE